MKQILKVKLITDKINYKVLLDTMNFFNKICNDISKIAFENKEFNVFKLHHLVYKNIRFLYPNFSSQLVIRAIKVVSDSYKSKNEYSQPNLFRKLASVVFDNRVIKFYGDDIVNIWTLNGRLKLPINVFNKELFYYRKGEIDLVFNEGSFYLLCTLEIPIGKKYKPKGIVGVDLGVKKIAVTSLGDTFSGEQVEKKRKQYSSHRQRLQKRGTRSAKRRIKKVGSKESRFRKDTNHVISKFLVMKAKALGYSIALENLKGINKRVTVRQVNRNERMSWSFAQLRNYITYKAELYGVPLVIVPTPYTSQTCNKCRHCEKGNRKSQEVFLCKLCGHTENADFNASKNIAYLGEQSISLLLT